MKLIYRLFSTTLLLFNSVAFTNEDISKKQSASIKKRIQITWGLQTKTRQIWDGYAEIDTGNIQRIIPFIRHGMIDESKLVTKNSWQSMTYTDMEGIFLFVQAPLDAIIKIVTKSHTFSFRLDELVNQNKLMRMEDDIKIHNVSEKEIR